MVMTQIHDDDAPLTLWGETLPDGYLALDGSATSDDRGFVLSLAEERRLYALLRARAHTRKLLDQERRLTNAL